MKKLLFRAIICLCTWIAAAGSALAAGLEVVPPRLDIVIGGSQVSARLEVKNPTADVELFEVSLDGNQRGISFRPQSFTLQAGQSQVVFVEVAKTDAKSISDVISVVATELKGGSGASLGGGVKVPLHIEVIKGNRWYRDAGNWIKLFGVLVFAAVALWVNRRRRV